MGMRDETGDAAVAKVDRIYKYNPVHWFIDLMDNGDETVTATVRYRTKEVRSTGEMEHIDFVFKKETLMELIPEDITTFELINTLKLMAKERDKTRHEVDDSLREEVAYCKDKYEEAMRRFASYERELRKAAAYEAIIWLMRKPKGWNSYISSFVAS